MAVQKNKSIARLENELVFNYQYAFSAKEQKTMLFLIANLEKESDSVIVSIKDIERILKEDDKKWGSSYKDIRELCFSLLDKKFFHKSTIQYKGTMMEAGYNWFQSVVPVLDGEGTAIKFRFSQDALPFLLQLKEYVQINIQEVKHMKSGHSIRLFQILKAKRNRNKEYKGFTEVGFGIDELKSLLGVEDKYPRFNNFRQKVLDVAQQEINGKTSIYFEIASKYENSREKRIEQILFKIFDTESEALNQRQRQLNSGVDKKIVNPYEGKAFNFDEFKKKFAKIHKIIAEKTVEQYKELSSQKKILNFDTLVSNAIVGVCENYYNFFISRSIKDPEKVANVKKMFEELGVPVKIK
ncbi:MAG: replication initiation protein [Saprospiraceae bacterium]|nr:replication initiation protein [Saprospiraceae bacterium]